MTQLEKMRNKYEGLEFVNGNNESYIVIRYFDAKTVQILFPETNTKRIAVMNAILLGNVKNPIHGSKSPHLIKNRVGLSKLNNSGQEMTIVEQKAEMVKVHFTDSESERWTKTDYFMNGEVTDFFAISVYNVGFLGKHNNKDIMHKKVYGLWLRIMRRCYSDSFHSNHTVAYAGVKVDKTWHCYAVFQQDIKDVKGYSTWCNDDTWELDKDLNSNDSKIYSPETCQFMSHSDNVSLRKDGVLLH